MNNIFEKNINALAIKDNELATKLANYVVTDIPQLVKENNFYNLLYKGVHLHNPQNPLGEAKEIFAQCENSPVAIHMIYGLGLGYLFQYTSAKSLGNIILIEPDLNILKIAFTLVDFSNDILKKNVYIADNLEKASEYLHQNSNTKNTPLLLTTQTYRDLNKDEFTKLVETLQTLVGRFNLDLKYTQERFYPLVKNIIKNIPSLIDEIPLTKIKDFYSGKTAVVVSAGPTLDRNIDTIKKYRESIVLIVVGTAMKALAQHNITPDFLCMIEAFDTSKQVSGLDLSKINFVTEPYSNPKFRNFEFKQIFSHISNNLPVNSFWSDLINESTNEYFSKGTVSYTALNVARILGCSKIILVGQDLAYVEGQCYSKNSAYKDLQCSYNEVEQKWEITAKDFDNFVASLSNSVKEETRIKTAKQRLENLNKSLYYVRGIKGDMIPTESVYAAFIEPLSKFTQKFKGIEYINTSLVGAQIDGFENISLEEALAGSKPIENRDFNIDYKVDIEQLKTKLLQQKNILIEAKQSIYQGQAAIRALNNNLKRYKSITVEVLKELKKVTAAFLESSTSYQNTAFDYITAAERIEIDYLMKVTRNFDLKAVENMSEKMNAYFNNAEKRLTVILDLLKKAGENLQ